MALAVAQLPPRREPLGEERRPQVRREQASPVQQALGEPVLPRRVALRLAARRDLGHADDGPDAGFRGRLGEVDRRVEQAVADGVDEVGTADAVERRGHAVEVQQVAVDHFGTGRGERTGPVVVPPDHRPDAVTAPQQEIGRHAPGLAGGAGDQEQPVVVGHFESFRTAVRRFGRRRSPSTCDSRPVLTGRRRSRRRGCRASATSGLRRTRSPRRRTRRSTDRRRGFRTRRGRRRPR